MAIYIIDGKPGSGKTLYAVHHLVTNQYSLKDGYYYPKDKDYNLISNIDGLILDHIPLDTLLTESGGDVKAFFSKDNQEALSKKIGRITYLIDEAQFLFPRKFYDTGVFNWLEYHRHFGQDVYLVTQSVNRLPKDITELTEYITRALPRSRSLYANDFRYSLVSGRDIIGNETIKFPKKIFALYKSQNLKSSTTVKRPFMRVVALNLTFAVLVIIGGVWYLKSSFSPGVDKAQAKTTFPAPTVRHKPTIPSPTYTNPAPPEHIYETEKPETKRVKLSHYTRFFKDKKPQTYILYNGIYSPSSFPHPITIENGFYYGDIPLVDIKEG